MPVGAGAVLQDMLSTLLQQPAYQEALVRTGGSAEGESEGEWRPCGRTEQQEGHAEAAAVDAVAKLLLRLRARLEGTAMLKQ